MLNRWEFHIHLIISPLMKDLPGLHLKLLRIPVKADKSLSIPSFISPISCHLAQQIHAVVTRSSSNISPNNLRFHQAHTESLNFPNDSMGLNIFNSPPHCLPTLLLSFSLSLIIRYPDPSPACNALSSFSTKLKDDRQLIRFIVRRQFHSLFTKRVMPTEYSHTKQNITLPRRVTSPLAEYFNSTTKWNNNDPIRSQPSRHYEERRGVPVFFTQLPIQLARKRIISSPMRSP